MGVLFQRHLSAANPEHAGGAKAPALQKRLALFRTLPARRRGFIGSLQLTRVEPAWNDRPRRRGRDQGWKNIWQRWITFSVPIGQLDKRIGRDGTARPAARNKSIPSGVVHRIRFSPLGRERDALGRPALIVLERAKHNPQKTTRVADCVALFRPTEPTLTRTNHEHIIHPRCPGTPLMSEVVHNSALFCCFLLFFVIRVYEFQQLGPDRSLPRARPLQGSRTQFPFGGPFEEFPPAVRLSSRAERRGPVPSTRPASRRAASARNC